LVPYCWGVGCEETEKKSLSVTVTGSGIVAHTGNYFFVQNDANSVPLDPSIDGITGGSVRGYNQMGVAGRRCGQNPFDINQVGSVFYAEWWAVIQGDFPPRNRPYPGCKWAQLSSDGPKDQILMIGLNSSFSDSYPQSDAWHALDDIRIYDSFAPHSIDAEETETDSCDAVDCSGHGSCAEGACNCDTGNVGMETNTLHPNPPLSINCRDRKDRERSLL
jgi:hypothetical protein